MEIQPLKISSRFHHIVTVTGISSLILGIGVLIGWQFDIALLKSISSDWVAMKANTAVGFVLAGVSILLLVYGNDKPRPFLQNISQFPAAVIVIIGLATFFEYSSGQNLGIDQRLYQEPIGTIGTLSPGRMAPATSICFTLLGFALMVRPKSTRSHQIIQYVSATIFIISFLSLLGFIYKSPNIIGLGHGIQLAVHTAAMFLLISITLLCLWPQYSIISLLIENGYEGRIVRRLLPIAVAVPAIVGYLILYAEHYEVFEHHFGVALSAVSFAVVLAFYIFRSARVFGLAEVRSKVAENRLRTLSQAVEQSPAIIVITDLNGNIEYVNPLFSVVTGYSSAEVIGQNTRILKSGETSSEYYQQLWQTITSGSIWQGEFTNRKKSGELYREHAKISAVLDDKGRICHFIAIKEDITSQRIAAEEKRLFQAKLIQNDKLASLGLLVSGMAHEINNPNNFILFNSELLAKTWKSAIPILDGFYRDNGDFKLGSFKYSETRDIIPKLFSGLVDGSDRIRNIVDMLKNFARQDEGDTQGSFDIQRVIVDAIGILNHEIKKRCNHFYMEASQDIPLVLGNAQHIEQVLINLIMNALQSLPDTTCAVHIFTSVTEDSEHINVTVRDNGEGIPPEILEHITDPFFTTKGSKGGTGLGLSISQSLLEQNHGSISFVSERGKGTTATVTLRIFPKQT